MSRRAAGLNSPPFSLRAKRYAAAMRHLLLALSLLGLAACGKADNDSGPGGVTVGEARALDEAADMIEAQNLPPQAIPQPQAAPQVTASSAPLSGKPTG